MRGVQVAEQAFLLARTANGPRFVCRACLTQGIRGLHTTPRQSAELPDFFRKVKQTVFGKDGKKTSADTASPAAAADNAQDKRKTAKDKKKGKSSHAVEAEGNPARKAEFRMQYLQAMQHRAKGMPRQRPRMYEKLPRLDYITENKLLDYEPATSSEGLPHVGSEQWSKQQNDPGTVVYEGFAPPEKPAKLDDEQWRLLVWVAAVEAQALHMCGRNPAEMLMMRAGGGKQWPSSALQRSGEKGLAEALTGAKGAGAKPRTDIAKAIPSTGETVQMIHSQRNAILARLRRKAKKLSSASRNNPKVWEITLVPVVRIAVLKFIMAITGRRLPDHLALQGTIGDLAAAMANPPVPEHVKFQKNVQAVAALPNVQVYEKRRTARDADVDNGRRAAIVDELGARDLMNAADAKFREQQRQVAAQRQEQIEYEVKVLKGEKPTPPGAKVEEEIDEDEADELEEEVAEEVAEEKQEQEKKEAMVAKPTENAATASKQA